MSGIIGLYYTNGRPMEKVFLEMMSTSISHRGPDGLRLWREGSVGLGNCLLWTTPESVHEKLPLSNASGELVITADTRIDNRKELLALLDFPVEKQKEISDGQVILAAYERWGERCPEKLIGDFAFAIWDGRRETIYCARDFMGVKPFYYYYRPGWGFAFASEIKAILSLSEVPRRLNEARVADYLAPMLEDKVITFYQGIHRLPPGHFMVIDRSNANSPQPYWELNPLRELRLGSDEEYEEGFREIFIEAVRCRLRSDFPVGSLLSGGLDSSSIVGVARKLLSTNGNYPLHTLSMVYEQVPACDERYFIQAVLAQGGLEPHFVHPDRIGALYDIERLFSYQDEPFWAPNLFGHWGALLPAARDQGIRVILDGTDGDTTVSHGYGYLSELLWSGHWIAMIREASSLGRRMRRPLWRVLWSKVFKPALPESIRLYWDNLRNRQGDSGLGVINRDFDRRVGLSRRAMANGQKSLKNVQAFRWEHWLSITSGAWTYVLEVLDKAVAPFAAEARYPFFDQRLLEFCLALPPEQKLSQGWNRSIERRALADFLPQEVCWRPDKGNLSQNFERGMLAERERLEEVLREPGVIQDYVDLDALRRVYQKFIHKEPGNYALTVWKCITLALWLRQTDLRSG